MTDRWTRSALLLAGLALVATVLAGAAAARVDAGFGRAAAKSVNVAFIYPKTGGLAAFGQEEYDGFQAGLAYTKGQCGGYTINPTYIDDATDPATAINAFKSEVGQGVKIVAGTGSSGIALQLGPLAAQNNVLYISGRGGRRRDHRPQPATRSAPAGRRCQDVLDAANIFPPKSTGKKIVVFAEDTAFGAGNVAAVQAIFGGKGHTVSKILSPFGAADLTPYAQQLKNSGADAAFVAWANTTNSAAMWQALQQQGVCEADDDRHRPREPRELRRARPARPGRHAALALRLPGAEEPGEHVADQVDGEEPPQRAGPVHAGRLRDRADDLPRARRRAARTPRSRSARSRAGSSSAPKGKQRIRAAGSRDAAADVPGAARSRERRPLRRQGREDGLAGQRPAPGHAVQVASG